MENTSGSLNLHFHFHVVVLDGVFTEIDDGVRFDEATHVSADDARALAPILQRRVLRLFHRRGLLEEHTVGDMLTWHGAGGFSLDGSVRIHGSDRAVRSRWARLLAGIHEVVPLRCPECGADPVAPADPLPDDDVNDDVDQTPAFDPTEPVPEPDLNQTHGASRASCVRRVPGAADPPAPRPRRPGVQLFPVPEARSPALRACA